MSYETLYKCNKQLCKKCYKQTKGTVKCIQLTLISKAHNTDYVGKVICTQYAKYQ